MTIATKSKIQNTPIRAFFHSAKLTIKKHTEMNRKDTRTSSVDTLTFRAETQDNYKHYILSIASRGA